MGHFAFMNRTIPLMLICQKLFIVQAAHSQTFLPGDIAEYLEWGVVRCGGLQYCEVWWSIWGVWSTARCGSLYEVCGLLWGVVVYMRCVVYCEVWWSIVVSVPANTVQYRSARPGFESLSVASPQWGLWGGRSFWEYCTTTKVLKHYAEVCCKVK